VNQPDTAIYSLSVVVPVHNAAGTLADLASRVHSALSPIARNLELILVNDGSVDDSWQVIRDLCESKHWIRGVDLMRNYGQHNALLVGIKKSSHDIVVTMDDDLQNPPEETVNLLAKLDEGYDVVYGTPRHEQHGLWRDMGSYASKLVLQSMTGDKIARSAGAFRVFRTEVRNAFLDYHGPFVDLDALLTWGTTRFAAVKVACEPRRVGTSNYTFGKLIIHALNMVTSYSTLPLQFASLIGFTFTLFGLGVFVYVMGRFLIEGGSVPGFPFLASVISIFSGAQLLALGVMGEYLARMHFRSMRQPSSVIRTTVGILQSGQSQRAERR
jgi:glycosyltransferase involved in cell wall biosynthesis